MKALIREWKLFYYRTALRQIDPLHKDVPYIVIQIAKLESEQS